MPQETQRALLSLKNLYRLLTLDDYPSKGPAVIARARRQGLTIHAFWQDLLGTRLAVTAQGRKLWQGGAERSRYLSDLFNRSRPGPFYAAYFEEVAAQVDEGLLLDLLERARRTLLALQYDYVILNERLEGFLSLVLRHDSLVSPAAHSHFSALLWQSQDYSMDPASAAYFDAYLFSFLALHAFFGEQMNNQALARLRVNPAAQPAALHRLLADSQGAPWSHQAALLTTQPCQLCREAMPAGLFVGREAELALLRQALTQGGKVLVSGMGGIGKTELVRQAFRGLLRQGIYQRVAYVQYQDSLAQSVQRAFPRLSASDQQAQMNEALARLSEGKGRGLLMVDGVDRPPHEDPSLDGLASLGCDVLLTSRLTGLAGSHVIPLGGLTTAQGEQVFAAAYGQQLQGEQRDQLLHLIEVHLDAHPLMCQMLGRLARSRHLSFPLLFEGLRHHGLQGSYTHQARTVQVEEVLRQLFRINSLPEDRQRLLRLFSLLPPNAYSFSRLRVLLSDISHQAEPLADHLQALVYLGWLREDKGSYSMHPVIMAALRDEGAGLKSFPHFCALLDSRVRADRFRDWEYVRLAQHALERTRVSHQDELRLLLNTVQLLCEQGQMDASRQMLDKAGQALEDPALATAAHRYQFHALSLCLLRSRGEVEGAREHLEQVLRLLPQADHVPLRPHALGHALFFAVSLSLTPQIHRLLTLLRGGDWRPGAERAEFCYMMSEYHIYTDRSSPDILRWAGEGLAELARAGGAHTLQAANLHHSLALGSAYGGQPAQAQAHADQYARICRDWYGEEGALAVCALDNSLGSVYCQAGEYDSALPHFISALTCARETGLGDSPLVEGCLNNLSDVYLHQRDLARAIDYANQAYEMHRRLNPEENLHTARLVNHLGCIYRESGQYGLALRHLSHARALASRLAGEDSLPSAEPAFSLGQLYLLMGQKDKAGELLGAALPVFESGYGPRHPRTLLARDLLAQASQP